MYWNHDENLEHIVTLTDPNACYDFCDLMVIKDKRDGKLYAATDSGCSCPTPFEDHVFPTDFSELRSASDLESLAANGPWTRSDVDDAIQSLKLGR